MTARFPVSDYDLAATLDSGQVFRWQRSGESWEGVVGSDWFQLRSVPGFLEAASGRPDARWDRLRDFLGLEDPLGYICGTFPQDPPMQAALSACPGLRLLRQDPWECLASFLLSSTKQIVQIRQCVDLLCRRFGEPVAVPSGCPPAHRFPDPERLAQAGEAALRECKLGFRARYLAGTALRISEATLDLESLQDRPTAEVREALMSLPGVGRKIADCVLLFAYRRQEAFPVDVWILRALRGLYFPNRRPKLRTLMRFAETHFGPHAGYAQQYLFHHVRTHLGRAAFAKPKRGRFRNVLTSLKPHGSH
ncbi:MAG: 3-methyladenine DNA glycosylase [Verrucomicrobia bacterium]|nr:3-methyladenine DNA glycosylase [Verrucomicrobiota bacterium]